MNTGESVLTNVQIAFEFQGAKRVLNKNPRVQQELRDGKITVAEALLEPWTIRLSVADDTGKKSQKIFTLSADDNIAQAQAKSYIKGNGTTKFEQFLKAESTKRGESLGTLAAEWEKLNMPDAAQHPRDDRARDNLKTFLDAALEFWKDKIPGTINEVMMNQFATWRRNKCKENGRGTGDRSIDLELGALSCLCDWAKSMGKIDKNPFAERKKFQRSKDVTHCHEFMPDSDEQWHDVLRWCFTRVSNQAEKRKSTGEKLIAQDALYTLRLRVIGGYLAFCGLTGLRPEEPVMLYRLAELKEIPGNPIKLKPGTVFPLATGERKMRVERNKNGQNKFVKLHPALADFLTHWGQWLDSTFGVSEIARPWFPNPEKPSEPLFADMDFTPLIRRLSEACEACGAHRMKPKGFGRAFYVRVRRSQGEDDATIAGELGQTTNGQLIRTTYGNPEDMAGGALFDWLPKEGPAAWQILSSNAATNITAVKFNTK